LTPNAYNRLLTTDSHCRSLLKFDEEQQNAVIALAKSMAKLAKQSDVSPQLIEAAAIYLNPPTAPKEEKDSESKLVAAQCHKLVEDTTAELPKNTDADVCKLLAKLAKKILALAGPVRSTLIDWAERTWEVTSGCTPISEGCRECWAARFMATRMADIYPGLA
jgi:hypothetical protein